MNNLCRFIFPPRANPVLGGKPVAKHHWKLLKSELFVVLKRSTLKQMTVRAVDYANKQGHSS